MSSTRPAVTVLLGTYERIKFLKLAIETIRNEVRTVPHEIIVVDGGSSDGTLRWLVNQKDILTIVQHNHGTWRGKIVDRKSWGYYMNLALKCAHGEYVCMLSDDCLVVPGAILNAQRLFEQKSMEGRKVGAVAFYFRDLPFDKDYYVSTTFGVVFVNHGMFLRKALEEVGFIDEETFRFYHADTDLCLRLLEKGYETIDSPSSFVEHYVHANTAVRKANLVDEKQYLQSFLDKWGKKYGFEDGSQIGGRMILKYDDTTRTSAMFRKILPIRHRFTDWLLIKQRDIRRVLRTSLGTPSE